MIHYIGISGKFYEDKAILRQTSRIKCLFKFLKGYYTASSHIYRFICLLASLLQLCKLVVIVVAANRNNFVLGEVNQFLFLVELVGVGRGAESQLSEASCNQKDTHL